jgi:phospholipid-binding lipoprotein MlaA
MWALVIGPDVPWNSPWRIGSSATRRAPGASSPGRDTPRTKHPPWALLCKLLFRRNRSSDREETDMRSLQGLKTIIVLVIVSLLPGCASTGTEMNTNDPFEPANRVVFAFNRSLDRSLIKPVAQFYAAVLPEPVKDGIHNVLSNIFLPITFANDLLQGDLNRGSETLGRFAINSTVGIAGLLDVAHRWGIPRHTEDFGQTLAVWGVGDGPYLVLPVLGPSGLRDATGDVADIFLHPFSYVDLREKGWWSAGIGAADGIDLRSRNLDLLDQIDRDSVDPYASLRSIYRQSRGEEIRNGETELNSLSDF